MILPPHPNPLPNFLKWGRGSIRVPLVTIISIVRTKDNDTKKPPLPLWERVGVRGYYLFDIK
jgi:hypothetical protein